jgi:hypothetical protein
MKSLRSKEKEHITRHKFAGDGYFVVEAEHGKAEYVKREPNKKAAYALEKRLRRKT